MTKPMQSDGVGLFFVVDPLRTGSSLMTRCLDDHPEAIGFCESETDRALFGDYLVVLHFPRMKAHGFSSEETVSFLDRRKQDQVDGVVTWYRDVSPRLSELYDKPEVVFVGDKSPDIRRSPELAARYLLISTVRDPRAIFWSIGSQCDSTPPEKQERWEGLLRNYEEWKPYLESENVLIVRYEDLVASPGPTGVIEFMDHFGYMR